MKLKTSLKQRLEREDNKAIIAEINGDSVGFVGLGLDKGRGRHIVWLGIYIKREYWGLEIGSKLMEQIKCW